MLERLKKAYPDAKTELEYGNHYQLLLAVVMSAQATDRSVNLVTRVIFECVKKPEDLLSMGLEWLSENIRSIGLWRTKAKNMILLSEQLLSRHQGQVPATREALCALAGVGAKTAAVVLNVVYGMPYVAVDTHVFRVSNRTGLAEGNNVATVEALFYERYTEEQRELLHHRLILHGRYVCVARRPKCGVCCLADLCPSRVL